MENLETLARAVLDKPDDAVAYGALCDAAGVREGRRAITADERYLHACAFID